MSDTAASGPVTATGTGAGPSSALIEAGRAASDWLFTCLLPYWAEHGQFASGGFVEQIGAHGPIDMPLRLRVQARQIYVFAEAGRLGWDGPWRPMVDRGLRFLLDHYLRADGLVRSKVDRDGACIDDTVDNYDQAFALFALAHARRATGDAGLETIAGRLLDQLLKARAHPVAGLHEAAPPVAPLKANPHMHLFEAMQVWSEVGSDPRWGAMADDIARLATSRFIDPASGALHELFGLDWERASGDDGRIVEPGHEFEWTWLLRRWTSPGAAIDPAVVTRLYHHGVRHGIDKARGIAINAIDADGAIIDANARLWPQTERLKAALVMCDDQQAVAAWQGLYRYRRAENPALFVDICAPDGSFVDCPAYASSLYHIVCAISELIGQRHS